MCLIVRKGTEITVTKEEMTVYKIVYATRNDAFVRSQYMPYTYEYGVAQKTALAKCPPEDGAFLDHTDIEMTRKAFGFDDDVDAYEMLTSGKLDSWQFGFHFFATLESAQLHYDSISGSFIARFVIPKGSKIILNETGLGITDTIMYFN